MTERTRENPPSPVPSAAVGQPTQWREAESAPRDGSHILVTQGEKRGFGICGGNWQDFCAVVHYWPSEGEEGFYLSSGGSSEIDDRPVAFTHWMPLPKAPDRWFRAGTCESCGGRVESRGGMSETGEEWGGNCLKCGRGYGENEDITPNDDEPALDRLRRVAALWQENVERFGADVYGERISVSGFDLGTLLLMLARRPAPALPVSSGELDAETPDELRAIIRKQAHWIAEFDAECRRLRAHSRSIRETPSDGEVKEWCDLLHHFASQAGVSFPDSLMLDTIVEHLKRSRSSGIERPEAPNIDYQHLAMISGMLCDLDPNRRFTSCADHVAALIEEVRMARAASEAQKTPGESR